MSTSSSSTADKCLSLSGTKFCPQYQSFSVATTFALPNLNPTVADFDKYMTDTFSSSENFSKNIKDFLKCPTSTYTASNQRYFVSVNCALIVDTSVNCNPQKKPEPLCRSVMDTFLNKFVTDLASPGNTTILNKDLCSSNGTSFSELLQTYTILSNNAAPNDSQCISGAPTDISQCGFSSVSEGMNFCATNSAESCCKSTTLGGTVTELSQLLPIKSSPLTTGGSNLTETTSIPPKNSGLIAANTENKDFSPILIFGVAFATFIGLFSLGLCCCLFSKKKRSSSDVEAKSSFNINKSTSNIYKNEAKVDGSNLTETQNYISSSSPFPVSDTLQAVYDYVPNLSDEIYLYVGDPVLIKQRFDDGWALGYNMTTKQEGTFPMSCDAPLDDKKLVKEKDTEFSNRNSSLFNFNNNLTESN
ncbi:hypothetical protein HDU92_009015 [Lobulomyces angularis]|nr:hypothetical protein HDU92_009015 [Lobulomyces angularis]